MRAFKKEVTTTSNIKKVMKYFILLPTQAVHSGHPTGQGAVYAQKKHPLVAQKISEMVNAGISDTPEVKRSLRYYVDNLLSKELGKMPLPHDRAFYPTNDDIRNDVSKAKRAIELSTLDQENLRLKVEEWKKATLSHHLFFRPYHSKCEHQGSASTENDDHEICEFEDTLLYIQQEDWQKELLACYGNSITLIDATYKTAKYSIPLFFVCVKTNVSYSVVAEFIVQSETCDNTQDALSILKTWNPTWKPSFFMSDYSDAEIAAIKLGRLGRGGLRRAGLGEVS